MYIDIIVFTVLLVLTLIFYKKRKVQGLIFYIGAFDTLIRVVYLVLMHLPIKSIAKMVDEYLPSSIVGMISKYTNGIVETILIWIYVGLMICFLYFIIKIFINKKKI